MKILTWNINGIRAASKDSSLKKLLDSLEADIICLQETKITRDQLDALTAIVDGYYAFYSFSKVRDGYSGVATFCKLGCTPLAAEEGLTGVLANQDNQTIVKGYDMQIQQLSRQELYDLDAEGRALLTEHALADDKPVVVINIYCPRAEKDNEERWSYKQTFYRLVQKRSEQLLLCGKHVIVLGDFNLSHTKLDHCDPDIDEEYFASNDSRVWMSSFLQPVNIDDRCRIEKTYIPANISQCEEPESTEEKTLNASSGQSQTESNNPHSTDILDLKNEADLESRNFVDLFRYFNPIRENAFTCWSTVTSARKTNYGTRIDYIIASIDFVKKYAVTCDIRPDIHGSDHCPVEAVVDCIVTPSSILPDLCTALMPEFRGKQQSIKSFMTSRVRKDAGVGVDAISYVKSSFALNRTEQKIQGGIQKAGSFKRKLEKNSIEKPSKLAKKSCEERRDSKKGNMNPASNLMSYFSKKNRKNGSLDVAAGQIILETNKDCNALKNNLNKLSNDDLLTRNTTVAMSNSSSVSMNSQCDPLTGTSSCDEANYRSELIEQSNQELCTFDKTMELEPTQANKEDELVDVKSQKTVSSGLEKSVNEGFFTKKTTAKLLWKNILKGPEPPPLCQGHDEECVLRTVKKKGPNFGRQFYCCARPEGRATDKEARCGTFLWRKR